MPYVLVHHKVANYAKWKRAVASHKKWRRESGEKSFHTCRSSEDPNDVLVWCEWDTAARMKKFIGSPKLREAMQDAGIVGKPQISFWNKLEDLSV